MPIYEYYCHRCEERKERFLPVSRYKEPQDCTDKISQFVCGYPLKRLISVPMMVSVQADISYESPTSGKMINSYRARAEDLAESNCVAYDPDQKQDQVRNVKAADDKLENKITGFVEQEIAALPVEKKERLVSEMERGMTCEIVRQ
jgi:putative FmdB family regulatory protein